jgi:prefoldin subunit 5
MRDHVLTRLDELKHQYQLGEGQLRELGRQEAALRETLLRIAGAIQVLEELLSSLPADAETTAAQDGNRETHVPLTVP